MTKKKIKNDSLVTQITDFEETLMWMSARRWLWSDSETELDPDYPEKLVEKYWGGLLENQRERLILDIKREIEYGWSDKMRCGRLLKSYSDAISNTCQSYSKCDEFEFTMIRLAIQYACGRQTIASATLPEEIIENRYKYMSAEQRNIIVEDLTKYLDRVESSCEKRVFGSEIIDDKHWQKFLAALDVTHHFTVKVKTEDVPEQEVVCFKCDVMRGYWNKEKHINKYVKEEIVYPLGSYLERPMYETYIPAEYIFKA